jgi:tryptophan 2-monooxygenase
MPFISRVAPATSTNVSVDPADYPAAYVDTLYDYAAYLRNNLGRIAHGSMRGVRVAIVGSGAAGLISAYQLIALGADVTIYEADDRAGGRLCTVYPIPGTAAAFEMGAMRVPPCEQLFNYFARQFGVSPGGQFPDPGKVDTRIIYRNTAYDWPAGQQPPNVFDSVTKGWNALANQWMEIYQLLVKPTPHSLHLAQQKWQQLIYSPAAPGAEDGYSSISFYTGLAECFVENFRKYGLDKPWSGDDFELFGALGVGSGGFGPLYSVNFAEIARLVVNGLESDQQFYPGGMQQLVDGFLHAAPDPQRPSVQLRNCIRYRSRVTDVEKGLDPPNPVRVTTADDSVHFDAVILATTTRSMQVDMNITDQGSRLIPEAVGSAVRQLHLMNSSKLFVLTKSKFWQRPGTHLPSNIQADGLVRGLYCLDYYPSTPYQGYGVVLISYTWGDDSTKYLGLADPAERVRACLRSLETCAGDFVSALRPEIMPEHTRMIDWQLERNFFGAFKLNLPGQDQYNQRLNNHFLSARDVFLAGDSVGWCGGWIESALQSGMNAACAVARQFLGDAALFPGSPMTQSPATFDYGPRLAVQARRVAAPKPA